MRTIFFSLVVLALMTPDAVRAEAPAAAPGPTLKQRAAKKARGKKPRAAKSRHRFRLGAALGGGYDSNMLNDAKEKRGAGLLDAGLRARYGFRASPVFQLRSGVKLGLAYHHADAEARGLKLKPGAKVGFRIRLFGGGGKRRFRPTGTLGLDASYTASITPTLDTPAAAAVDPAVCDPQNPAYDPELCAVEEVEDSLEDELAEGETAEEEENDAEEGDADEEEGGGEDEAEAEADADEAESDAEDELFAGAAQGGAMFTSKPARHNLGGTLSFALKPLAGTTLRLSGRGGMSDVGETEGKPSSDSKIVGGGLKLSQDLFAKLLKLSAGYGVSYRIYDERQAGRAPDQHPYRGLAHTISVGARLRLVRRLKLSAGYNLGLRSVVDEPSLASRTHKIRLGAALKLKKGFSLFLENSLLFLGMPEKADRDRSRYQGVLGARWML